jgi:hypothetical protein
MSGKRTQRQLKEARDELARFDQTAELEAEVKAERSDSEGVRLMYEEIRTPRYYLRELAKFLPRVIELMDVYNSHPARKDYGMALLNPRMSPTRLLAAARREADRWKVRTPRGTRAANLKARRAKRNALEFAVMDACIKAGISKNRAAKLTRDVAPGRNKSVTALLKRYRKHSKGRMDKATA